MIGLTLLTIAIAVLLLPLAGSVWYSITGSLEMFPTHEQQEKARIAGLLYTSLFAVLEAILISAFVWIIRRKPRGAEQHVGAYFPTRADASQQGVQRDRYDGQRNS